MAPMQDPEATRRRRMRTFLSTLIVGAGITAGYALMQDQVYQSSATLKVHDQRTDTSEGAAARPSHALLSRPLLGRVLERLPSATQGIDWADYPHLKRWYIDIAGRPAVQRGYDVPMKVNEIPIPD